MKKTVFTNKKIRSIDGFKVRTVETEIASPYNAVTVEVGTTGRSKTKNPKNSCLYLKISDSLNSDINITRDSSGKGFILRAKGDCEISTLIEALEFSVHQLKSQCEKIEKEDIRKEEATATLKQINLIKYLASQNPDFLLIELPTKCKDAGNVITFLKNPSHNIPNNCANYIELK